jgi:ribosomal protein S12 methylthiotransferase
MARQKRIVRKAQRSRIGARDRVLVDGPTDEHQLVLRGRFASQAPDIDPQVFLTDCDPSSLAAGSFIDVEIVGAREYDLVARPFASPAPVW